MAQFLAFQKAVGGFFDMIYEEYQLIATGKDTAMHVRKEGLERTLRELEPLRLKLMGDQNRIKERFCQFSCLETRFKTGKAVYKHYKSLPSHWHKKLSALDVAATESAVTELMEFILPSKRDFKWEPIPHSTLFIPLPSEGPPSTPSSRTPSTASTSSSSGTPSSGGSTVRSKRQSVPTLPISAEPAMGRIRKGSDKH